MQRSWRLTVPRTISLGFLAVILAGTFLLMLPWSQSSRQWGGWLPALFTSTSAVCVTGLSVVDVGTYFSPFGQLVLILLIQVGGLGYMTATTFLLMLLGLRFGLRDKVAIQQSLDRSGMAQIRQVLRAIAIATLACETVGAIALFTPLMSRHETLMGAAWSAIFHSVSAFNNAGFSIYPDNLVGFVGSLRVNWIIAILIVLGGIGYPVILEGWQLLKGKRRLSPLSLHFRLAILTTLGLLIGGWLLFLGAEHLNPKTLGPLPINDQMLAAWFQTVTPRTAGFNTIDQTQMSLFAQMVTIALMFIGASPGGTGGGVKTTALAILIGCTISVLRGRESVLMFQRQIPQRIVQKATAVVVGSSFTIILGTLIMAVFDRDLEFIQLLFEAVSAFATVGLDLGVTATANAGVQLVLIALMYIGRVGILLLMQALLGDPHRSRLRYPEEELLVG